MERYYSFGRYLKERFGRKIYKLSVDAGFTCPNRDGSKGVGGCIFCSESGSGDFAERGESVSDQLERAKVRVAEKAPAGCGYIAYFQSFTNTYAPVERLEKLFASAMDFPDIVAVSVGTRPDCLEDDKLALLGRLNRKKPFFVELGLQTSNEETAKRINRCYENAEFERAVKRLSELGIETVAHIILGLPGETEKDMLASVEYACSAGIGGIKLQLLHILRGTALASMDYTTLSREEYYGIVGKCLEIIPENVVIHRLTGDGSKKLLIEPMWSADKHTVLNGLNAYLEQYNIIQGAKAKPPLSV